MLTSAVSYVPYCERQREDLSDSGAFSMQVPDYTTRIEPIGTSPTAPFMTESVQSTDYAAEDHVWKGVLVRQIEQELDPNGGNTIGKIGKATDIMDYISGELKTTVGSQCRTWSTARMAPVWFGLIIDDTTFAYIKDNSELFTYTTPTLYDWNITETAQQENVESAGQGVSVKTLQSRHARALKSSYEDNELKVEYGAYESPYLECRVEAITTSTTLKFPFDLEDSPIPTQWAKEFTGVYTPSATVCRIEPNGSEGTFYQPHVYPAAVPNYYFEVIGKERPRIGGVHCSSASERNTMSLGAMFFLGERSYKDNTGTTQTHNDCIAFGSDKSMNIVGTTDEDYDDEYPTPPSLTASLTGFGSTNRMVSMENGVLLDDSGQPWNTYMLSYNPSFMNLKIGTSDNPDTESRTAYNRYKSTAYIEEDSFGSKCEQFLDYTFVHYGPYVEGVAPPAAFTIEGVCRMESHLYYNIRSAYTIAQAGNSLANGMIYKLDEYKDWYEQKTRTVGGFTRQAKEVFPSRITKLSCRPQNNNMQGVCGLSNGKLTDDFLKTKGSIAPLADVETHSSPRLLSYMCIDNQFADSDTETVYGRPYIVTSGVVDIDTETEIDGITLDLTGDIGENKSIAWPSSVNWATDKFSESDVQMRFLYKDGERMRYAAANSDGEVVEGDTSSDNVVDWGGYMHIVHRTGNTPFPGNRQLYTSTPEVRGSSTTSYFFADIPGQS